MIYACARVNYLCGAIARTIAQAVGAANSQLCLQTNAGNQCKYQKGQKSSHTGANRYFMFIKDTVNETISLNCLCAFINWLNVTVLMQHTIAAFGAGKNIRLLRKIPKIQVLPGEKTELTNG